MKLKIFLRTKKNFELGNSEYVCDVFVNNVISGRMPVSIYAEWCESNLDLSFDFDSERCFNALENDCFRGPLKGFLSLPYSVFDFL